jgi:hypothetical protein
MATVRPIGAKLFLEGMEVPFIGATLNYAVNQASIAYIDLVPHSLINNIKPRTLVHLFVKDYMDPDGGYPYVLAWEGEVFGFSMGRTPTSRTFTISCIDYSSYWDSVLAYFFNAKESLGAGTGKQISDGQALAEADKLKIKQITPAYSMASYFKTELQRAFSEGAKDFLEAFIALYESIANINDFYLTTESRLRIVDRICMKSSGALMTLLQQKEALDWIGQIVDRGSGWSTLRTIIQDLMGLIFHDFVTMPIPSALDKAKIKNPLPHVKSQTKTIGNFIFKPNLFMMPPPICNVFFPDEYSSFQYNRNFFSEPTRLIYKPELPQVLTGDKIVLVHEYVPASFEHFMYKKGENWSNFVGDGDMNVSEDFVTRNPKAYFMDEDKNPKTSEPSSARYRLGQFYTNEDMMRGPLIAQETMMPATTGFMGSISDSTKRSFSKRIANYLFYKKRFQGRALQITSHLKLSVVPGFTALVLDDSDAEQNLIAYCSSVTHRIYATQGGYTNVTLTYARTADEEQAATSGGNNPLIPPWFATSIFGSIMKPPESKAAKTKVAKMGNTHVTPPGLADFYKTLLGDKGSAPITLLDENEPTVVGGVTSLINQYKDAKKQTNKDSVPEFINMMTRRDYISMKNAFTFINAETKDNEKQSSFMEFSGKFTEGVDREGKDLFNKAQIELRRGVVKKYRDTLKNKRGFRG